MINMLTTKIPKQIIDIEFLLKISISSARKFDFSFNSVDKANIKK